MIPDITRHLDSHSRVKRYPSTGDNTQAVTGPLLPSSKLLPVGREDLRRYWELATRFKIAQIYIKSSTDINRNDVLAHSGQEFIIIRADNWHNVWHLILQGEST